MTYKNLTWQDIRTIVHFADTVIEETSKKDLLDFGQEGYYNTVLNRLSKYMKDTSNKSN